MDITLTTFIYNPIRKFQFKLEILSDASLSGWGIACNKEKAAGFWTQEESQFHINYLELLAAFIALKSFTKDLENCEILLRLDNTTAISFVNRMGGVQFPLLNNLSRLIWQWCEHRRIWLYASYIPSKENITADEQSRNKEINTEWELAPWAFTNIVKKFGEPQIDCFASRTNKKCNLYISWNRDPDSLTIDAFTVSWNNYFFYAFPPFSLVLRVLKKIILEKSEGILVVPLWSAQPWYPVFTSLLLEDPIIFKPNVSLLLSSCSTITHPLASRLTLIAGHVSGKLIP